MRKTKLWLVVTAVILAMTFVACGKDETPSMYTVTVTAGEHGSVTPDKTNVEEGGSVTLTITPDTVYEVSLLSVNGDDVTDDVTGGGNLYSI